MMTTTSALAAPKPSLLLSDIDTRLQACETSHTDADGSAECELAAFVSADRLLNADYTDITAALRHPGKDHAPYEPEIIRRLVAAERAWITFRDAECAYESTVALNAPLEGYENQACRYTLTKARVEALMAAGMPQNAR